MINKREFDVIVSRLRGMAAEAEIKRAFAVVHGSIPQEFRYQGERAGLLKALDLLEANGHGKGEVMGNGCE
jgi:hypothetical protein